MSTIRNQFNDLLTKNYKRYQTIAIKISNGVDDPQDILQECLTELCEKNDTEIERIMSYIDYYIIQMLKISNRSKTSRYQQKYNKIVFDKNFDINVYDAAEPDPEPVVHISLNEINSTLNHNCSWYEKEVFLRYANSKKSFKTMERETGIPATSLFNTFSKVRKMLQHKFSFYKNIE